MHASGVLKWCRAYSVNRFTGQTGVFILCQSITMPAGLYTSKSDTCEHLSSATVIFCLLPCLSQGQQPPFRSRDFRPYSCEFVSQHVTAAIQLKQQSASSNKAMQRKGKQIRYMKKRKQTENGKTPGSEQPVVKSVCGSLMMRQRVASAIIVRCWMHNLQVGGN